MGNSSLHVAKASKNDEFYTRLIDVNNEIGAYLEQDKNIFRGKSVLLPCDDLIWSGFVKYFSTNFRKLGLKKLIATCFAGSAGSKIPMEIETSSSWYDPEKSKTKGKKLIMERDVNGDGIMDSRDVEFKGYLEEDGDFRSNEVTALRNEADFVITNPPFSLFREFLAWLEEGKNEREKDGKNFNFIIVGPRNAITYKEVFPKLKANKMWLGTPFKNGDAYFSIPEGVDTSKYVDGVFDAEKREVHFRNCTWFTDTDHAGRHQKLGLAPAKERLKHSSKLKRKLEILCGEIKFPQYDNYDAIEVPFIDAIPSDYAGTMGVPITYLDRHNPEQFEIVGMAKRGAGDPALKTRVYTKADCENYSDLNAGPVISKNGILKNTYPRLLIRNLHPEPCVVPIADIVHEPVSGVPAPTLVTASASDMSGKEPAAQHLSYAVPDAVASGAKGRPSVMEEEASEAASMHP